MAILQLIVELFSFTLIEREYSDIWTYFVPSENSDFLAVHDMKHPF